MRNKEQKGDLTVQAIAGTHVVLLGIDLPKTKCPGLLGFALRREDHTEGEKYWLSGYKTFASIEPSPPPGILYSTRQHPIQGFHMVGFFCETGARLHVRSVCSERHAGESERVRKSSG
jgi:hypothetical protein